MNEQRTYTPALELEPRWEVAPTLPQLIVTTTGSKAQIATISDGWPKADMDSFAKLIAAAPDMYDALERAATALHDLANPASRSAHAMKRGRENAKHHERLVREAIEAAS